MIGNESTSTLMAVLILVVHPTLDCPVPPTVLLKRYNYSYLLSSFFLSLFFFFSLKGADKMSFGYRVHVCLLANAGF